VAEDGKGLDDIHVVALDARDGTTAWARTFW